MPTRQSRRCIVDSKPNWVKQAGLTPGKMALMVLLAVVLIGVLYHQLGGSTTKPSAVAATPIECARIEHC